MHWVTGLISVGWAYGHGGSTTWNCSTLRQRSLGFSLLSLTHSVIWFCCCHRAREWSSSRKLTQDQTVPGDSNVQAISNVQRIQQRLWLIILFPLPSPADFVQVFYGYLEDLENRQREEFANFFCLGLWIPYTDGRQPPLRAAPGYTASNLQKEWGIIGSPNTACNVSVVSKQRQHSFTEGKARKAETQQITWKYLLACGITRHLPSNQKCWSERWFWNKCVPIKDLLP